jgi:hypothetical protein
MVNQMKNYRYGSKQEARVARSLRGYGAKVKRSPGSRGAADLRASFSPNRRWNVQVKSSRKQSPAWPSSKDMGRLKIGASRSRATPVVCRVTPRSIRYTSARNGRRLFP